MTFKIPKDSCVSEQQQIKTTGKNQLKRFINEPTKELKGIKQRKKVEDQLRLNELCLEALLTLNQMTKATLKEITEFAIEEGVKLTGSSIGFFGFIEEYESKQIMSVYKWSKHSLMECSIKDKIPVFYIEKSGLWGEAIRQRRSIIINDYKAPHPWKKGYPEGHIPLARLMCIPLFSGDNAVMIAAVGNKQVNYDQSDEKQLTLLMDGVWNLVQRKKDEESFRLSEERFSKAFYNNQTMMAISRLKDSVLIDINNTFADVLGYKREELVGKSTFEKDLWGEPKEREEIINQLSKNGYIRNYEHSFKRKSGEIRFVLSSFTLLDINDEKCVLASAINITEKKKAEEVLRQSEELFYKAFHSSPAMMSITRLKDNILIDANDSFASALGFRREEMIGRSPLELNIWYDLNKREDTIRAITEKGSIKDFESKFIRKSGEIGYILSSLDIVNLNGDDCLLITGIDITERIKAEEALRKSHELFARAFDHAPYSLLITSLTDGKIKKANKEFLLKNGFTEEEVIGRSTVELNLWFDPGNRVEMLKQLEEKDDFYQELKLRKKDGQVLNVMFMGGKINIHGEECLITMQNDITELKTYQNELARLDRLNLVGEMAAGIGHEIRNPMTTIKGFLQLLKEKERYAQDRDIMDLMVEELDRANSIITEFLSLARNKPVELKMQSLNQKIKTILPLIQADAMKQDKSIELELGDIPYIKIDKNEIQQLILNLVRNGLEAMPPGGVLTIKTFLEGDRVVLAVKDHGSGIAPDILEKIGTPFFTTKDNGTGLGLAVCYSIAERNNARIDIDTLSEGTTFFVKFKG